MLRLLPNSRGRTTVLHPDDEQKLAFAFERDDYDDDRGRKIADALGLDLNAVRGLAGSIVSDLPTSLPADNAPESAFGISWWSGYTNLGTARRLLVGDYLIEVVHAIETNLLEARLHFSALREALRTTTDDPRAASPREYVNGYVGQLHVSGILRAAMSAVDCVGAATVGVLGLPIGIKRADMGKVLKWKDERAPKLPPSQALQFQTETIDEVVAAFASLEPSGWLDWASDFRNTFIHRGRRHQSWHPRIGVRLPSEPDRADLESMVASPYPEALHEPAETTLAGVLKNTQDGTFKACMVLLGAWQARRDTPTFIIQPREQWTEPPPLDAGATFKGFAPRELSDVDAVVMNPTAVRRWGSAAVTVQHKARWGTFT